MNRNVKKAECSAKSFFLVCMLLKLKKINFITVKDQLDSCADYNSLIPPKAYYHLGRLYEKKGLKQKAKENCSKFLELFKNADPGIAEVEAARKRLSEL